MSLRLRPIHLALLLAIGCASAQAGDLQQAYDLARQSDPQLAGSEANKRAQEEGIAQARANLLPQVNATDTLTKTQTEGSEVSEIQRLDGSLGFGATPDYQHTTSRNYSGNVQQSIYNRAFYTTLSASRSRAHEADAQYDNAAQTLITRVATAYFNVLSAIQDLASSRAEDRALKRQLDQANVRLQVGLAPITDAQEAKAQYDISRATTIGFETALSDAKEALTEITGQPIEHFKGLAPDFVPTAPSPEDVDAWVKMAVDNNPQVIAQQLALDAAEHDVDTARAGHLPTITANASYGSFTQWGSGLQDGLVFPDNAINRGPVYSLVLTVPIFSGFSVSSHVRQALALRDAAADTLEQTRRSIQRQARNSYHATLAGLTEIEARKQALLSAQTALEATETGLEVGTRTIVDVLINEQQLFSAQRDYARARNNFVVNELTLRQVGGNVQASDVAAVNTLLVSDAEAALDAPTNDNDIAMPGLPTQPANESTPAASGNADKPNPAPVKKARHRKAAAPAAAPEQPVTPH
ncbi:MAG TPA: TolC family outer membrane protein [Xanthomonadaceae bacterium]|jgi:outer membrane protein|nr:TolC family outer membrane protein [Xanthomonadaceae bacterium]